MSIFNIFYYSVFLCIILDSIEIILNTKLYLKKGLVDQKRKKKKSIFIFIILFRILLVLVFIFDLFASKTTILIFIIIIEFYIRYQNKIFLTAAEYVLLFNLIVLLSIFYTNELYFLNYSAIFILLCYFSNGYEKINSVYWKNNMVLIPLFSINFFYNKKMLYFLKKYPEINIILTKSIIFFQITFIFSLVHPNIAIVYLILGAIFHLGLTYYLKLNNFLLIFIGSYPSIYFFSYWIQEQIHLLR